jgi:hypothetical protein
MYRINKVTGTKISVSIQMSIIISDTGQFSECEYKYNIQLNRLLYINLQWNHNEHKYKLEVHCIARLVIHVLPVHVFKQVL